MGLETGRVILLMKVKQASKQVIADCLPNNQFSFIFLAHVCEEPGEVAQAGSCPPHSDASSEFIRVITGEKDPSFPPTSPLRITLFSATTPLIPST